MFQSKSRYANIETVKYEIEDGRIVSAVKLRRLPNTVGKEETIKGNTRLDALAYERYNDPAKFWHIADANTELETANLTKPVGRKINIPE